MLNAFTQDPAGDEAGSGLRSCDQANPKSVKRVYVAVGQHGRMIARGIGEVKSPGSVPLVRKHRGTHPERLDRPRRAQITPRASIASATLTKPAMLAPRT